MDMYMTTLVWLGVWGEFYIWIQSNCHHIALQTISTYILMYTNVWNFIMTQTIIIIIIIIIIIMLEF